MVSVNDLIADNLVSHQIGLQRLSNRTVRKILRMLSVSDRRIAERLLDGDITELSRRRQEKLLGQIRDIISEIHDDATGALRKELSDLAEYEGEFQLNLLQRSVGVTVDFASVSADQIVAAATSKPFQGKYLKEGGQDLAAATFRRVRDAVRLGIVEQRTTAEIVRDLRGTRRQGYKDGLLAIDKRNAEAVVRTAVNHTANAARQRLYDRNKRLIKGVQILATLDTRTSKICMGADNRIAVGEGYTKADFPKGTRFLDELPNMTNESRPPFHINSVVEGTLIATDAGLVPIEHVSVGTKVLTHCGRYKPVTSVICKPKDTKTIRLVCDNGSGISLSDDHPVLTLGRGWINAGDVKIGDVLAQDTEQLSTLPNSIRPPAEVPQAVLSNAHSMETSCREELISLGIFSLSAGMTSAVNLKQDIPDFEIGDVSKKWNLKGKLHTSGIKNINHAGLMACGVGSKGCGLPLSYLWDIQGVSGGVLGLHSLGRGFSNFGCKIRVFLGPVVAAGRARYMLGADSNGFVSSPNSYAVFLAG